MNEATVQDYINQAAALMNNPRFNAIVESTSKRTHRTAKANGGKIAGGGGASFDPLMASFEAQAGFGGSSTRTQSAQMQMLQEQQELIPKTTQPRKSNLPEEIQESFRKMPALSGGYGTAMTPPSSYYGNLVEQTTTPVQQAPTVQMQMPATPQVGIDYEYLKYIINEAVKNNMKQMLNESTAPTLTGLRMAGGNKIQFFDSKGNLYEGELKLKKKAQQ